MEKLTRNLGRTKNGRFYDTKKHQLVSNKEGTRRLRISETMKGIKGYYRSIAGGSFYPSGSAVKVDAKIIIITKTKLPESEMKRALLDAISKSSQNYGGAFYGSPFKIDSYELSERIDKAELDPEENKKLVDILKQSKGAFGYYVSDELTDSEEFEYKYRRKKK